jgi:phage shock protein C
MNTNTNGNNRPKRLYRSRTDRRLAGVCGGIGAYFEVDSTFVRLGWVVLTILTGIIPGIIVYIIAAIIIPDEPEMER